MYDFHGFIQPMYDSTNGKNFSKMYNILLAHLEPIL